MCSRFFLKAHGQLEHDLRKHRVILVCDCIACKEGMNSEFFGSLFFQDAKRLEYLLFRHSVFGITGIIHDIIADLEKAARIESA